MQHEHLVVVVDLLRRQAVGQLRLEHRVRRTYIEALRDQAKPLSYAVVMTVNRKRGHPQAAEQ